MSPLDRAKTILSHGGGILAPFDFIDHEIRFSSELKLRDMIVKEIEAAVEEAMENHSIEQGLEESWHE